MPSGEPRLTEPAGGDLRNLVAYRLRCKHYFCHLTRPPSYRQSSFLISTLGMYLRNVGKVEWVGIRMVCLYCMTQLILRAYITVTVPGPDVQNSTVIVS
jgi:hypothetical protein